MRAAFDRATDADPFLPFRHSVLPALLAMRRTHQTVGESHACLAELSAVIEDTRRHQLDVDVAALEDQRALTEALEARLATLRASAADASAGGGGLPARTPEQAMRERMEELERQRKRYDADADALLQAVNKFIDERLAALLAAEELGGPVVGDKMSVDDDMLVAGFTAQGRPRKIKATTERSQDRRQLRLDQIWGPAVSGDGDANETTSEPQAKEAAAAGREMRDLLSALVIGAVQAQGQDSAAAYVTLERESAAVRFLVRARVAQFHPRDARKLRLVDFGRELDD
jgi:hypothetical protein